MRLVLAPLALLTAGNAFGWGCAGHHIIALMAREQLTASASTAVDRILREAPLPADFNRFCKERPEDLLALDATWADDVRTSEGTGPWHFVNIPLTRRKPNPGFSVDEWCGKTEDEKSVCVVQALRNQLAILKDAGSTPAQRGRALRYLVHLVEDMHQPLHDVDNSDQGGNCAPVKFFSGTEAVTFHSVWDTWLIDRDQTTRKLSTADYAKQLSAEFAKRQKGWRKGRIEPNRWAWDGQKMAVKSGYGLLSPRIPVENPGAIACDAEKAKVAALHIEIGEKYFTSTIPIIREQLAKASARLAAVLNATL